MNRKGKGNRVYEEAERTNPVFKMTSLVTLIFFMHPKQSSSRVHSSCFSIGGGFSTPEEFENMIGVVLLRLPLLDSIGEDDAESTLNPLFNRDGIDSALLLLTLRN